MKNLFFLFFFFSTLLFGEEFSLQLSPIEQKNTTWLMKTLGKQNWFQLLLRREEIKRKEKQLAHLDPLSFLAYTISNPELKECLVQVTQNRVIWHHFMKKLAPQLDQWADLDYPHLTSFCKVLNVKQELVYPLAFNREWEKFVLILL